MCVKRFNNLCESGVCGFSRLLQTSLVCFRALGRAGVVRITAAEFTFYVGLLLESNTLYISRVKILFTERHLKENTVLYVVAICLWV